MFIDLRYFKLLILLNNLNLGWKFQRFTPAGCKDIGIIEFDCLETTV